MRLKKTISNFIFLKRDRYSVDGNIVKQNEQRDRRQDHSDQVFVTPERTNKSGGERRAMRRNSLDHQNPSCYSDVVSMALSHTRLDCITVLLPCQVHVNYQIVHCAFH